jgi:hypothetical protein
MIAPSSRQRLVAWDRLVVKRNHNVQLHAILPPVKNFFRLERVSDVQEKLMVSVMPEAAKAGGNLHVHPRHTGVGIACNRTDNDNAARFHYHLTKGFDMREKLALY